MALLTIYVWGEDPDEYRMADLECATSFTAAALDALFEQSRHVVAVTLQLVAGGVKLDWDGTAFINIGPEYSHMVAGTYLLSTWCVCHDGKTRLFGIEQFADGLHIMLCGPDGNYTDGIAYETSRKAINAACKWEIN
jgi:hypothetical protein